MSPFIAHLIGDFILQNEWMAVNKKRSSFACLVHVLVYLIPFFLCHLQWWQIILVGMQHFIQDRTEFVLWWMHKWKRINLEEGHGIALFVDQTFHLVWIEIVLLMGAGSMSFLTF